MNFLVPGPTKPRIGYNAAVTFSTPLLLKNKVESTLLICYYLSIHVYNKRINTKIFNLRFLNKKHI